MKDNIIKKGCHVIYTSMYNKEYKCIFNGISDYGYELLFNTEGTGEIKKDFVLNSDSFKVDREYYINELLDEEKIL